MAGNFRGVLIFVIFVVDLAVTKNHHPQKLMIHTRIAERAHAQGPEVGIVHRMTDWPSKQDHRSYSEHVSGAQYKLMRINKNLADGSLTLLSTSRWCS